LRLDLRLTLRLTLLDLRLWLRLGLDLRLDLWLGRGSRQFGVRLGLGLRNDVTLRHRLFHVHGHHVWRVRLCVCKVCEQLRVCV